MSRVAPNFDALQSRGIPFLVLKGAALNAALYEEPGVRAMVDVDVLIRPGDAARVDRVLADAGCVAGAELLRADFFPRYHYEWEYFTPQHPPVKIDLHVRPLRPHGRRGFPVGQPAARVDGRY